MNEEMKAQIGKLMIKCPSCSKPTDSLKRYHLADMLVFIGIAAWSRRVTYTACPVCMQTILLKNMFSWNILTGNMLWILIFMPIDLILLIASTTKGHSKSVVDLMAKAVSNPSGMPPRESLARK